jgi:hypothetical protein
MLGDAVLLPAILLRELMPQDGGGAFSGLGMLNWVAHVERPHGVGAHVAEGHRIDAVVGGPFHSTLGSRRFSRRSLARRSRAGSVMMRSSNAVAKSSKSWASSFLSVPA